MKYLKKYLQFDTIRKKMLLFSLFLTLITIITSIYTINNTSHIIQNFDYMITNNVHLTELSVKLENTDKELLNYLTTENSDSLDMFMTNSDTLRNDANGMIKLSYDNSQMMLTDIGNMINEYIDEANSAIAAKRGRNINECNDKYKSTREIANNIYFYTKQLNFNQFHETTQKYAFIADKIGMLRNLNIAIVMLNLLFNMLLILWFTDKISVPIVSLAKSAEEISMGNFDTDNVEVNTRDEIKLMADTFNTMKENIKTYIDEMKSQAEIKASLMEEKVENLKMKSLLKTAEIQALQSQINPHFLFNTLNAGVQLAMMEDAEKTGILLEKMSNLFRYNLRKIDDPVILIEEINNLYTYIYILETRFGDMIKFSFDIDIDDDVKNLKMPAMIIQPLIENACIHGVGEMESGAEITFNVRKKNDFVQIIITDNGKGMDNDTINNILSLSEDRTMESRKSKIGHTTGIGFNNVHRRLNVFYEREDILSIESTLGAGTKITLMLPIMIGGQIDV